jgi:hypothetical protein
MPHQQRDADIRPVLFELLTAVQRATSICRSSLLRRRATPDLRALADFCDAAEATVAGGRAMLASLDDENGDEFRYCPPRSFIPFSRSTAWRRLPIRARRMHSVHPPGAGFH